MSTYDAAFDKMNEAVVEAKDALIAGGEKVEAKADDAAANIQSLVEDANSKILDGASTLESNIEAAKQSDPLASAKATASDAVDAVHERLPSSEQVKDAASNAAEAVRERLPDADQVKAAASDAASAVHERLPSSEQVKAAASDAASAVHERLPSSEQVKDAASSAAEAVRERLPEAETVKSVAYDAYETAKDKAADARDAILGEAEATKEQAAVKIQELCEESGSLLHDGASKLDERVSELTGQSNVDTMKQHIDSVGAAVRDSLPDKDVAEAKLESAYDNAKAAVIDAKDAVLSERAQDDVRQATDDAAQSIKDAIPQLDVAQTHIALMVEQVKDAVSDGISSVMGGEKTEEKLKDAADSGAASIQNICEEASSVIHDGASSLEQ